MIVSSSIMSTRAQSASSMALYMADALRETGDLSKLKKASIVAAVSALSLGLGVLMFLYQGDVPSDMGIVRSAFILISTLTVPHFILEHLMTYKNHNAP